jgi:hypothetical protein
MSFSRANPSPRYRELQTMYRQLHEQGETQMGLPPEQTFNGMSLLPQLSRIKALIERTGANTMLDYGCGKGLQYDPRPIKGPDGSTYESVVDFWDIAAVHCYDPCYVPYSKLPAGRFDGVVSTDVLEHCPEQDVPWIVDEIFGYADRFVYANVACYPARKHLPNGENAHCTIKPLSWWEDILRAAAARRSGVVWEVWVQSHVDTPEGKRLREEVIGGG